MYCQIILAILVIISSCIYKDDKDNPNFWQPFSIILTILVATIGSSFFLVLLQYYKSIPLYFYLITGCFFFFLIYSYLLKRLFKVINNINYKNHIRLIYKYTATTSLILYITINLLGVITLCLKGSFIFSTLDEIFIYISYIVCNMFVSMWMEKLNNLHIGISNIKGDVLFLRPFRLDSDIEDDLINIIKDIFPQKSIIRIGDPKLLNHGHNYAKNVFLTDENWKEKVHQYAKEADIIVIAIDSPYGHKYEGRGFFKDITGNIITEGVLWEVVDNNEFQDKTIYYVAHLPSLPVDNIRGRFFFEAIKTIKNNIQAESLFICAKKNCFFVTTHSSLLYSIIDYREKSKVEDVPNDVVILNQFDDPRNSGSFKSSWLPIGTS